MRGAGHARCVLSWYVTLGHVVCECANAPRAIETAPKIDTVCVPIDSPYIGLKPVGVLPFLIQIPLGALNL